MTQPKTNKKALLTSALSLLLCCTMLIGTTWAWFTDSVTSAGNKIQSGTLKVDMLVKGGNTGYTDYTSVKNDNNPVFNYNLWEPGYTLVTNVKVKNEGNLALKYTLRFVSGEDIAAAKLAEAIDVYYVASEVTVADRNTLAGVTPIDLKTVFEQGPDVVINDNLGAGEEDYATIVLKMRESAGNEYQGLTIPAFDICLLATQDTVENDSFNNQYDVSADENPDNAGWPYQYTGTAVVTNAADPLNVTAGIATVTVPAAALTAGDRYELALDDVVKDETNAPEVALSFELKLKKNGAIIDEETAGTEYDVALQLEKYLTISSVKHNGEDVAYNYDINTGIMTLRVKHFSPFAINAIRNKDVVVASTEEVQEVIADFNSGDHAVPKDADPEDKEPVMVALANATYTEAIVIKQYPDYDEGTHTALTDPSRANIVEFVGGEDTVITGKVTVYGSHNGQSSNTGDFKGDGCVIFKNITFDGAVSHDVEESDMIVNINDGSKEVLFENCTFKNSTYIGLGGSGKATSGYITFKNCTFEGAACLSGYCYNLTLENCSGLVDGGKGKGFVNIQNSGKVLVKDCDIDIGDGAYAFRTTNNMSAEITVIDSTIRATAGSTNPLVIFRGTNGRATFTNCTLFTETVELKNGAVASQLTIN